MTLFKKPYCVDTLSFETKKLEAIYQQKLAYLDELKKSALQKAFGGKLELKTVKFAILLAIPHDYVDKRVKGFILLLWQKYYMFSIQSIA